MGRLIGLVCRSPPSIVVRLGSVAGLTMPVGHRLGCSVGGAGGGLVGVRCSQPVGSIGKW